MRSTPFRAFLLLILVSSCEKEKPKDDLFGEVLSNEKHGGLTIHLTGAKITGAFEHYADWYLANFDELTTAFSEVEVHNSYLEVVNYRNYATEEQYIEATYYILLNSITRIYTSSHNATGRDGEVFSYDWLNIMTDIAK